MASLSNTELSKFRNGEYRWEIFTKKLKQGEEFELTPEIQQKFQSKKTALEPLDPEFFYTQAELGCCSGDFSSLVGVKFQTKFGILGLTALQKTEEFRSSSGTGGGSEQTAYIECRTARECATITNGMFNGIPHAERFDHTFEDTYWENKLDESWKASIAEEPKLIVSSEFTKNLPDYTYPNQNTGNIGKWVSDAYNRCKVRTSYASRNINKWNPADIWCSSGSLLEISSSLNKCSTLGELSQICYSSQLKGISLKKGGTEIKEVRWIEGEKNWQIESWKYLSDPRKTNTKGLKIRFNFVGGKDKTLTIRTSGQSLKAETQTVGSNHRNGSCGLQQINLCLASQNLRFRFDMKRKIRNLRNSCANLDETVCKATQESLIEFVEYFKYLSEEKQRLFIADLVRHCVCQCRNHCTYLKVS